MYEKSKSFLEEYISNHAVAFVWVGIIVIALLCGTSAYKIHKLSNDVNRTVQSVKELTNRTNTEIDSARRAIENAKSANARTGEAISRSQATAGTIGKGIGECEQLARECQEINKKFGDILAEIGKANGYNN